MKRLYDPRLEASETEVDVTLLPDIGTPTTSSDGIVTYDQSALEGSRITEKKFSGDHGTFLNGKGSFSAATLETLTATAANTFAAGDIGYLISAGTVTLADADVEASSKNFLLMATEAISGGASGDFAVLGKVTVTTHGLTVGAPIFISTTAGDLTNTAPSATGDIIRVVGYALDANTIYFKPDSTWIEVT